MRGLHLTDLRRLFLGLMTGCFIVAVGCGVGGAVPRAVPTRRKRRRSNRGRLDSMKEIMQKKQAARR